MQYAVDNNIIDLSYVREKVEMTKRKQMLNKHQYEIWQGKDGAWYTYLLDKDKVRKLKRRTSKKKLENDIIAYYTTLEENPLISDLFEKWNDERYNNNEIGKNSYTKYGNDFKRFFQKEDELCNIPMKEITEADLLFFIKMNIKRYSLTRKSYASLRTLIIGVFKYA